MADQRNDGDGPLACNSMCSWWMAMAAKPAAAPAQPRDAAPPPVPAAAHVAAPARTRRAVPPLRVVARALPHARAVVTRVAEVRPRSGPARSAILAAELARPVHPTVPEAAAPPPLAVLPSPVVMPVAPVGVPRAIASVPVQPVTEARAERVRLPAPDRPTPTIGVSMQSGAAKPMPPRAQGGLMGVAVLCALALSVGRTGRARVAVPAAAYRRREKPLLDAFKAQRRTATRRV